MTPIHFAQRIISGSIVPLVNAFRNLQEATGAVTGDITVAADLLVRMCKSVQTVYTLLNAPQSLSGGFKADVDQWLARGLTSPPQFQHSLAAYQPPQDTALTFFIAPFSCTNGPTPTGHFLECFLAYREEPEAINELRSRLSHSGNLGQSCHLLAASAGLLTGNCIVFFPENVATGTAIESQSFAIFFFNKFRHIYHTQTEPLIQEFFGARHWSSFALSEPDCYVARSLWGYLHDFYHHRGARPLDRNLQVKTTFFPGLLEEIKVDCQAAKAALEFDVPFGHEIAEFIIFERLFRYPSQPDATMNFDAGTGFLLFEWLLKHDYGLRVTGQGLALDIDECVAGMSVLAQQIETIEALSVDDDYCRAAYALVRTFLPAGTKGAKFAIPTAYQRLVKMDTITTLLRFEPLICDSIRDTRDRINFCVL